MCFSVGLCLCVSFQYSEKVMWCLCLLHKVALLVNQIQKDCFEFVRASSQGSMMGHLQ